MRDELSGHPDDQFVKKLIDGLTYGCHTGIQQIPTQSLECKNLLSCKGNEQFILEYLHKEVQKGYLLGPFESAPFHTYRTNPIGVVQKKYSDKKRIIMDLSAPHDLEDVSSLNSLIDKAEYSLSYVKVDDAAAIIKQYGRYSWLNKFDLADAFKVIPVKPELWPFQGLKYNGKYYFYKRLVFGSRSSPAIFTLLSEAIAWIVINKYKIPSFLFLLDDYIAIIKPEEDSDRVMALITHIFGKLSIPLNPSKTVGPTFCLEYLGLILDSDRMEIRLPLDKLERLREMLDSLLLKKKCTKQQLLCLLGHLNFACRAIGPGRTFISRIIEATKGVKKLYYQVNLSQECKADMAMWKTLCDSWNGISLFIEDTFTSAEQMDLFTDASGTIGYGGYYRGSWFFGSWNELEPALDASALSIAFKELYAIIVAAIIWGKHWQRKRIVFFCDNQAVVDIISKGRSHCTNIMKLMRRLVIVAAHCSFNYSARHIPSKSNSIADALSRFNFDLFQKLAPDAAPNPCPLPLQVILN